MVYRRDSLSKRIEKLHEYQEDLKEIGTLSYEAFLQDKKTTYATERLLFLISEALIDFFDHILAAKFNTVSDSYESVLENAFAKQLIDKNLYTEVKGLGGFRNVLAHAYLEISGQEVHRHYLKMQKLLPELLPHLEELLDRFSEV